MSNTKMYNRTRNERDKADRRLSKMIRKLETAVSNRVKNRIRSDIQALKDLVEGTRTYSTETGKRIRTSKEVAENVNKLSRMNIRLGYLVKSQKRSNQATQIEINRASVNQESAYTKSQVQIFYRATQRAWQNKPLSQRNEAILAYYGYNNLAELFEDITQDERNQNVQKAIQIVQNPGDYTDEERAWAFDVIKDNEDEYQISPAGGAAASARDVSPVAPM